MRILSVYVVHHCLPLCPAITTEILLTGRPEEACVPSRLWQGKFIMCLEQWHFPLHTSAHPCPFLKT